MRKGADIRFRVLVCIAVLVCMGIFGTRAVHAQETGRIEILCKGTSMHQKEVVFEGAKFALYQVGNSTENGWELTDEFRRAQVVLNDSSASGQRENAELLWKYAKEQKLKGVNRETDKKWKTCIFQFERGVISYWSDRAIFCGGRIFCSGSVFGCSTGVGTRNACI